jgi:biotin synthase
MVLGLIEGFLDAKPTTAYLLTYLDGKCTANCGFCPQARRSRSRADMLSRVTWPVFAAEEVVLKLSLAVQRGEFRRVCIQALNYPTVLEDLLTFVKWLKLQGVKAPVSVSCQPLSREKMEKLAEAGAERIGIPLDAATKDVFDRFKGSSADGPYDWNRQRTALLEAVEVFGRGRVSTHLIVGLGETEKEMAKTIQWCVDNGVYSALFAFTPVSGTVLEHRPQPSINHYRRVQAARHLIAEKKARFEKMGFSKDGRIVDFGVSQELMEGTVRSGTPFLTSGCPNCNRPYYNEKPSGPLYNFPKQPTLQEIREIEKQLKSDG